MVSSLDLVSSGERPFTILLTFHGDLETFVKPAERNRALKRVLSRKASVKDVIESCGVPHPEVDLIIIEGQPVDLSFHLNTETSVEIYPVAAPPELFPAYRLQSREAGSFVADGHLGKLTRDLRLLGIDVSYQNDARDDELLATMLSKNRALLTRDRRLLMHRVVHTGYFPRSQLPMEQTVDVIRRFNLAPKLVPFSRCLRCNEQLRSVSKASVFENLEPLTRLYYHEFRQCSNCSQTYWRGSHFGKLQRRVEQILALLGISHPNRMHGDHG
jgi:uncharacterized protein